ncbi:DUF240 domain-containing protein, partial [Mycoplasmoides pneumoniae]
TKKIRFKTKAFLLAFCTTTVTLGAFLFPTLTQKGSSADINTLALHNKSLARAHNDSYLVNLANASTFSEEELAVIAKNKDWKHNFEQFEKDFVKQALSPKTLGLIDVYNLLSGFKQSVQNTVNLMNQLQAEINAANAVFPVSDSTKIPKVSQKLFGLLGDGFFPQLHPKGLKIADNIAALFDQYNLKSIALKNFDLNLERKNDIVIQGKVCYSFSIKMDFATIYEGDGSTIDLQFALNASTTNFANLTDLQDSFWQSGKDLNTQLFWKPSVHKLISNGTNDLTTLAQTALGDSLFDTKVNLTESVIEINNQTDVATKFREKVLNSFKQEREKAHAEHVEKLRKLEEERKLQEAEAKAKAEEVKKLEAEREAFNKSLTAASEFKQYWSKKNKDVTDKKQLAEALKISLEADRNRTFSFLIAGFRTAIDWYYNAKKENNDAKQKAFGSQGIQFHKDGLNGIYMSDWLRGELTSKSNINLKIKELKVQNKIESPTINWIDGVGIKQDKANPFNYRFEVDIKYTGGYQLYGFYAFAALFTKFPSSWSGEMNLKFIVDGSIPVYTVAKKDYPGSLFQFNDKDELLFTLYVKEQISFADPNFMNLLRGQNLHDLELVTGATKPPVVDLASYLHFVLLSA